MQRILFVCTGNTCRSPMAEAILKHKKMDGLEVKSAGIYALSGSDASEHAKKVLLENEIEHAHQSMLLTKAEVDWATLILTMTVSHKATILWNYPHSVQKTYTLKEFTGETLNLDVMDPFGSGIEMYRNTYKELDRFIDKMVDHLQET